MRGGRLREVLIIGPLDWENFGVLDNWPPYGRWSLEVVTYGGLTLLKSVFKYLLYFVLFSIFFFLMYECVRVLI